MFGPAASPWARPCRRAPCGSPSSGSDLHGVQPGSDRAIGRVGKGEHATQGPARRDGLPSAFPLPAVRGSRSSGCRDRRPRSGSSNPNRPDRDPTAGRPARRRGRNPARIVARTGAARWAWIDAIRVGASAATGRIPTAASTTSSRCKALQPCDRGSAKSAQQRSRSRAGQQADARHKILHDPRGRSVGDAAVRIAPDRRGRQRQPERRQAGQSTITFRPRLQSTAAPATNSNRVRLLAPVLTPAGIGEHTSGMNHREPLHQRQRVMPAAGTPPSIGPAWSSGWQPPGHG